ncbi:hypothetical protein [Paenibacillus gallinarum]|uniref:Uncharacterized protein n=1 Tax=Paenibacillus gallinarum TaxID=2762232 RepID=A0ABR8T4R1_9BACL|nr:hypothetical protein [Paenibacillus gallinarum]MBD7970579.1 hypothetical protein [Paenibacillus gallinarum]
MTEVRIRRKRKKKKKSRKGLWITLITLVILVGGGWGGYHFFTHKDVQAEDIGVDEDFFDFTEFGIGSSDLPVSSNGEEEDENSPEDETNTSAENTSGETATNPKPIKDKGKDNRPESGSDVAIQNQNGESKDIEKEIESKYSTTFQSLESAALSKLDTLAENALKDYKSGRSLSNLSSTYMSAANKLQKKIDEVFNVQLKQMKAELKANGLDNDLALQAEAEYKEAIAAKKSEMLRKVAKVK